MRNLSQCTWLAYQYLCGSISREAPYEVEYCLKIALGTWRKKQCIITTGLIDFPHGYCFLQVDPWEFILAALPAFDSQNFTPSLVLIGVPRLYKNKPIFCIPLYHELGHFVDRHWGIANLLALTNMSISWSHWAEYFADVFAASYVGESKVRALSAVASGAAPNQSHPGTSDRIQVIEAFLAGRPDLRLDAIYAALARLGAPPLVRRFQTPDIAPAFDDLRTFSLQSDEQVHGLFNAAWLYFERCITNGTVPWSSSPPHEGDVETIVNNLTEKTLRNYAIVRQWNNAASATP